MINTRYRAARTALSGGITMNKIITISREYGAGGHSIGTQVAKELGIPFYDRDIVRETAKASGFDIELIEREGESESFTDTILKNLFTVPGSYYNDTREAIYEVQKAIILRLAKQGPCVILGRCADHILKEAGIDAINVFVYANELHRGARITEMTGETNAAELHKMMTKKDSNRRNYYNHHTGKKWGDSHNSTLSLDSGALGYKTCVELIKHVYESAE